MHPPGFFDILPQNLQFFSEFQFSQVYAPTDFLNTSEKILVRFNPKPNQIEVISFYRQWL